MDSLDKAHELILGCRKRVDKQVVISSLHV